MADFHTQWKVYGYRYNFTMRRPASPSHKNTYRVQSPVRLFRRPHTAPHDCRALALQAHEVPKKWEALQRVQELRGSGRALSAIHKKKPQNDEQGHRVPDRLLCAAKQRGSGPGQLNYPRGLAVNSQGEILVADTLNHRVQCYNPCAVQKSAFGSEGTGKGQFRQPTGVAVMPFDHLAVADRGNRRVQIFSKDGRYKTQFSTIAEPYSITADTDSTVLVAGLRRTIEIYLRGGKLGGRFEVPSMGGGGGSDALLYLAAAPQHLLVVSDPADRRVKVVSYPRGQLLHHFSPQAAIPGLQVTPAGISVLPTGELLLCDALNHAVSVYGSNGALKAVAAGPVDDCGAVQQAALTPEGHIATVEFSTNGPHCLKVFRYRRCACHYTPEGERPGSARQSPAFGDPPPPTLAPRAPGESLAGASVAAISVVDTEVPESGASGVCS